MTAPSNGIGSKPASETNPSGLDAFSVPNPFAASPGNFITSWLEYAIDSYQRSVLSLELLRERGNEQAEITSRPMATVLHFDHDSDHERKFAAATDQLFSFAYHSAAGNADRSAQASYRYHRSPRGSRPRCRRFQSAKRDRRRSRRGPPSVLHRLWLGARARPAVSRRRRGANKVLRTRGRTASGRLTPLRHWQLSSRLSNLDGRRSAAGPLRAVPDCRFTDVVLARRARKEPDALHRRLARRQLAQRFRRAM